MAVVPSGWAYKRGNSWYDSGATMPSPVKDGDELYRHYTKNGENIKWGTYVYKTDTRASTNMEFKLGAGWTIYYHKGHYGERNYMGNINTLLQFNSINNANVIKVSIPLYDFDDIANSTSLNITRLPSNLKCFEIYSVDSIITLKSLTIPSLPSSLIRLIMRGCGNITTTPSIYNTNITDLSNAFRTCTNLVTLTDYPKNVTNISYICHECSKLKNIPNSIPDSVTEMEWAFRDCTLLTKTPILSNSSRCNLMPFAFTGCSSLVNVDDFIIPDSNADGLFKDCISLVDVSNLTINSNSLKSMFAGCTSLKFPPIIPNIVTDMTSTFDGCIELETIPDIPSNVSILNYAFRNCQSLTNITLSIPKVTAVSSMFENCNNLTGTLYYADISELIDATNIFARTTKPIILLGRYDNRFSEGYTNVYTNLIYELNNIITVRCDLDGTLNDKGQYVKLSFNFNAVDITGGTLYVPKVYIKNAQQQPQINWVYTDPEGVRHEIPNSTDIEVEHIEAATLSTTGSFETIFLAGDDTVEYSIYVATSMENISQGYDIHGDIIKDTYYWNLLSGKAIFTGKDYIFDATPDGKSFKVGGPIDEENEKGFIVGERGIPLLADQYPSTFNGPATFNSLVYLRDNEDLIRTLNDYFHPVWSTYSTLDPDFNPEETWGGTWKKLPEGYVLMSGSASGSYIVGDDTSTGSGFKEYGENTHTLTTNEMPSHTHIQNAHNHSLNGHTHSIGNGLGVTGGTWSGDSASSLSGSGHKYGYTSDSGTTIKTLTATGGNSNNTGDKTATNQNAGGGQAHNIMQKSIAVYWWIRIA